MHDANYDFFLSFPFVLFYFHPVAYADEVTDEGDSLACLDDSRLIKKCSSSAVLDKYASRTGAGVDRTVRAAVARCNGVEQSGRTSCPTAPLVDCNQLRTAAMPTSNDFSADLACRSLAWKKRHERLLAKSCSTPVFHSATTNGINKTSGAALDSELLHLTTYAKMQHFTASPLDNFKNGRISQSPFVSPMLADDSLLSALCPVYLVVSRSRV